MSEEVKSEAAAPVVAVATPTGEGLFQTAMAVGGASWMADEPVGVGGTGTGPAPHDMVAAGLAACTAMTLRMYAERKGWPSPVVRVSVRFERRAGKPTFLREILLAPGLAPEVRARLMDIADKCPVHKTLSEGAAVETTGLDGE